MIDRTIAAAPRRGTFLAKLGAAFLLILLADILFFDQELGWTLGLFALAWTLASALLVRSGVARVPRAAALAAAAGFALVLIDDPNPLAWCLFWVAIASAALLARTRFVDAASWALQLFVYGVFGLTAPLWDARRLGARRTGRGPYALASLIALPLIGGTLFVLLFASANPVIATVLARIEIPGVGRALLHLLFAGFVLVLVWPSLRPRARPLPLVDDGAATATLGFDVPRATLLLSLVTFNAIFLVQNLLDLVFLWQGAALPAGVTMADYAHRGAYALIATALLAGLFVLVALRPGGAGARSPLIRGLVIAWVAQNLLLVASSMLRTIDYIEAYSLTVLRIAALAWMVLVAVGLVLICWRLLAARSTAWLINANGAAALLVLTIASVVDLGATAARYNVDHARNADRLDLCYLASLGSSALLPLIDLERRAAGPRLRDQAGYLRVAAQRRLRHDQADWHSWTWRGARRLAAADAAAGTTSASLRPAPDGRLCDGTPRPTVARPVVPVAAPAKPAATPRASAPLTKGAIQ